MIEMYTQQGIDQQINHTLKDVIGTDTLKLHMSPLISWYNFDQIKELMDTLQSLFAYGEKK